MKKTLLTIIMLSAAASIVLAQSDKKARLRLKDGTRIQGVLVEEKENGDVIIEQGDGVEYEYAGDEVVSLKLLDEKHHQRKGYFGISAGANLPVGEYNSWRGSGASVGGSFNLNFGFLFSRYIGIAGSVYGKVNPLDDVWNDTWYYDDDFWSYGGIAVGPLFSLPASQWLDIDFRPMIALNVTSYPGDAWYDEASTSPAFMGSILLRLHAGRRVSFVVDADYFYTNTNFNLARAGEQHISSVSIGAGVAISFK